MTKDYVQRVKKPRRSKPKAAQPRKSKKPQPTSKNPTSVWTTLSFLFLLSLVASFFYFSLSEDDDQQYQYAEVSEDVAEHHTVDIDQENIQIEPEPVKNEEPDVPPKPEEKWSYIRELENKEVSVVANPQEVSERPYLMQCGAYQNRAHAEERKALIALEGLESEIRAREGDSGIWWHSVVLGPYQLKRRAERDRNLLRRANIEPCAIWYWN